MLCAFPSVIGSGLSRSKKQVTSERVKLGRPYPCASIVSRSTAFSVAHFGSGILVVIQVADECGNHAFKVDVVFPQRVVGVDEKGLTWRKFGHPFHGTEGENEFPNATRRA